MTNEQRNAVSFACLIGAAFLLGAITMSTLPGALPRDAESMGFGQPLANSKLVCLQARIMQGGERLAQLEQKT